MSRAGAGLALAAVVVAGLAWLAATGTAGAAAPFLVGVEPVSHLGGCVYKNEFQRGDQAVWLISVTDATTGQPVSQGIEVLVRLDGKELKASFNARSGLWAAALPITWDMPTGTLRHVVIVRDGRGNVVEWRPAYAANQVITIIPGPLAVEAAVLDPVSGAAVDTLRPGGTVRLSAEVRRPTHGNLYPYGKADRELTLEDKGALLSEGVTVKAVVGQGAFVQATGKFLGETLAEVPLTYDAARETWRATLSVPRQAQPGTYSVAVVAVDAQGNAGTALAGPLKLDTGRR